MELQQTMTLETPQAASERPSPSSSSEWREYFRSNAAALMVIPWERGVSLTPEQRAVVAGSVPQFQLGESSDGHQFVALAREYAAASGDAQYVAALRRFIAEEQRHGRDLGRVLDLAGIPRIERAWADTVFRWLRRRGGLEWSVSILVTAEFIAQVYYIALRDATESSVLSQLCKQILRDEDEHVRFQCERIAILRQGRRAWSVAFRHLIHRGFFAGTCLVFWWKHAPLMRAGGFGFFRFWGKAWQQMNIAVRIMNPDRYAFADHSTDAPSRKCESAEEKRTDAPFRRDAKRSASA